MLRVGAVLLGAGNAAANLDVAIGVVGVWTAIATGAPGSGFAP